MSPPTWFSLLREALALPERFVAELDDQLRAQARALAGIDLAHGYALLPPDDGFAIRDKTVGDAAISIVEGYLVDPRAHGHLVALGWRSRATPAQRIAPSSDVRDVEFAWLELPIAALAVPSTMDTRTAAAAVKASFPVAWNVDDWTSTQLRLRATRPFSGDECGTLTETLADAVRAWNTREAAKIHYVGEPQTSAESAEATVYVDLGAAGADAVVALLNAVAASRLGELIREAAVGRPH